MSLYAKIAVESVILPVDKLYTYRIPESFSENLRENMRVVVPFGKGNKKSRGIVVEIFRDNKLEPKKFKSIFSILDKEVHISDEMMKICLFMKERCFCTLYDCIKTVLPSGLNISFSELYSVNGEIDSAEDKYKEILEYISKNKTVSFEMIKEKFSDPNIKKHLNFLVENNYLSVEMSYKNNVRDAKKTMVKLSSDDEVYISTICRRSKNYEKIISFLKDNGDMSKKDIEYYTGVTHQTINSLKKSGVIEYYDVDIYRAPYEYKTKKIDFEKNPIVLNYFQKKVYDDILSVYDKKEPSVYLVNGVTGSGKTHIYMKMVDKMLSEGKNSIILIPEIALTSQLLNTFYYRYGDLVSVLHSGLGLGQQLDEWKKIKEGKTKIAVGTRSCIFAPFDKVDLIVIDEEHEQTYKSDSSPKYNAKEIAKYRCTLNKSMVLLLSATPSVESMYNAKEGKYYYSKLESRFNEKALPDVEIIDMKKEINDKEAIPVFSSHLIDGIKENIKNDKQSILLLNRRGYYTSLTCKNCGEPLQCDNCSISLTYHSKNKRYMCHYCGFSVEDTVSCKNCGSEMIENNGIGIQKVEESLNELIPEAKVLRMDADTSSGKNTNDKMLSDFKNKKYNVLLGTQMVAKGLNFPDVTLVGVISADQSLYMEDYKARERTFSLLTQVVGRSGRGDEKGSAVIQTFTPNNDVLKLASMQDYDSFYDDEIKFREMMKYPPFNDVIQIMFTSNMEKGLIESATFFKKYLKNVIDKSISDCEYQIIGPNNAGIYRMNNNFRCNIIIKCKMDKNIRKALKLSVNEFMTNKLFKNINLSLDINPNILY